MIVFAPTFRFPSSTAQVMLHDSAVTRTGLGVSVSFNEQSALSMAEMLARITGPVADGWFVPTRLLDQAYLSAAEGKNLCTGFVMGRTRAQAQDRVATLLALIC